MDFLIKFLSVLYILHDVPVIGVNFPSIAYAGVIISLFLLLFFNIKNDFFKIVLPISIIIILDFFLKSITSDIYALFQRLSGVLQVMIYPMLSMYILKNNQLRYAKFVLILWLLMNFVTCITTYYGCLQFPGAARYLATGDMRYFTLYNNLNIGGFSFVYTMVLLTSMVLMVIKKINLINKYKLVYFILAIVYVVNIAFMLSVAEYTTSLLLFVLSFAILFLNKQLKWGRMFMYATLVLVLFVLTKDYIINLFLYLSKNIESYTVSMRLKELSSFFSGDDISSKADISKRQGHYVDSLSLFFEKPWGIWSFKGLGGHSFIFDALAKYGLVGLICLCASLGCLFNNYVKVYYNSFYYNFVLLAFLLQIIMLFLNTQFYIVFLTFVMPVFIYVFSSLCKRNIYQQ